MFISTIVVTPAVVGRWRIERCRYHSSMTIMLGTCEAYRDSIRIRIGRPVSNSIRK